jgi:hypothetical protein
MKKWLTIFVFLFPMFASAQTYDGITIPAGHPRLWVPTGSSQLTTAEAWLTANPYTSTSDQWVQLAFHYVASSEASAADCTSYVIPTAMSTTITDTSPTNNGSDSSRYYGEQLILTYDWCYDQMTSGQRATLTSNLNSWFSGIQQQTWGGATMPDNNYFWGNVRNELEWGIASYWENTTAAQGFIDDALTTRWTNAFIPTTTLNNPGNLGGVAPEGSEYGRYLFYYSVVPFESADVGGRDVYGSSGYFKQAVYYMVYTTTPAVTYCRDNGGGTYYEVFPFSDDEFWYNCNSAQSRLWSSNPGSYYGNFMQTAANYWPTIDTGKYAQQWIDTVGLQTLTDYYVQSQSGGTGTKAFSNLPLDYYATGMQYFWVRKAWDTTSAMVMMQMGTTPTYAHHHYDYGSWQFWRGGRWMSRETASYVETFTGYNGVGTATSPDMIVHNGVLINPASVGCTVGTTCYGNGWSAEGNGPPIVNRLESQTGYAYADVNLTPEARNNIIESGGHKERDNPAAGYIEREYVFVRSLETLVTLDRVLSVSPDGGTTPAASIVKTFIAHCETNPTLVDASHETCTNGTQELYITNLEPVTTAHEVVNEASAGDTHGQYRIEINDPGTTALSYLLNVMQAGSSGGANVTASVVDSNSGDPTSGTFTVTLAPAAGSSTVIVFNKGETSSGGTINVAAGGAVNLTSSVEAIAYTNNGPVWGQNNSTGIQLSGYGAGAVVR